MRLLKWLLLRALILVFTFGFFTWAGSVTRLQGTNIRAYVPDKNNKGVRVCKGLRAGMSAQVLSRGKTMARVKFGNDAQPPECRNRWAWVPHKYIAGGTSPNAARPPTQDDAITEAGRCPGGDCSPGASRPTASLEALFSQNYQPLIIVNDNDGSRQSMRNCDQFIKLDGSLGPFGRGTLQAIEAVDPGGRCFAGGQIPLAVCPRYGSFSPSQRLKFWVYAFAAIAHDESGCNPAATNPTDGVGGSDGMFQLEYAWWRRRDSDRNARFCPHRPTNSRNLTFQFQCTASILKDVHCASSKRPGGRPLGRGMAFWTQLQGTSRVTSRMIAAYPGCR